MIQGRSREQGGGGGCKAKKPTEAGDLERGLPVRRRKILEAIGTWTARSRFRRSREGTTAGDRRGGRRARASKGRIPRELWAASAARIPAGNDALKPDDGFARMHPRNVSADPSATA